MITLSNDVQINYYFIVRIRRPIDLKIIFTILINKYYTILPQTMSASVSLI